MWTSIRWLLSEWEWIGSSTFLTIHETIERAEMKNTQTHTHTWFFFLPSLNALLSAKINEGSRKGLKKTLSTNPENLNTLKYLPTSDACGLWSLIACKHFVCVCFSKRMKCAHACTFAEMRFSFHFYDIVSAAYRAQVLGYVSRTTDTLCVPPMEIRCI